ncbi:tetratricopeptide repeat protein [Sorangium sp. So ce176]|uniref:tetratricopeptide repeat protein n=1 Tax=Sorangium sp. So ce176 TaxID=3133286 RepID=UPI003F5DE609
MQQDTKGARVSFRIENLEAALEQGIDNEAAALDVLVAAAAKGNPHPELWAKLHEAAARHDRFSELAFAYERFASERRFGMLPQAAQAEVLVHAAEFLADSFGDPGGARPYLERALSVLPSHQEAFVRLERILKEANEPPRLADLYALAANHRPDRAEQLALLRRAYELVEASGKEEERAIKLLQQILRIDLGDAAARWALEARYARAGRLQDVARLLEQALATDPPPADALEIRARLIDLYSGPLKELERALPHVEEVLAQNPAHEGAFRAGEALLGRKTALVRAAAALEAVHARRGRTQEAARMMSLQVENLRGPRRVEVQKRLVELLFQKVGDLASAFSLSEQILAVDPSDEAVRERFVALASALDRRVDAARVLVRASSGAKEKPLRARIAAELGELYEGLGDGRKARAAFQQALDGEPDAVAVRRAARGLAKLCERERDARGLAGALERLVEAEPGAEAREAAAERLARLYEEELGDIPGAIAAYRKLAEAGSSREPRALSALERLYDATGGHEGLAWVLERRAEAEPDRRAARVLAFRAAELRTRLPDLPGAVAAWRRYLAAFGASREAHARLIPLLDQERRWAELEALLEAEAELAAGQERASVLARIGAIRMARLDDPAGALAAYREALALDPTDRASRLAVEKMLGPPPGSGAGGSGAESSRQSAHLHLTDDQRIAACAVLEPIARAEGAAPLLVRVLETRAEIAPAAWAEGAPAALAADVRGRLAALEEAVGIAERELRDPRRALDLAARGLSLATAAAPERLSRWVAEVERLTEHGSESARRAPALAGALGDRAVDSAPLSHLARRAGEALLASGDVTQALALYRRALAFEPSSPELIARVDALLREQGSPEERLALYREALAQPCPPPRRRELLHAIGTIQRRDLGDLSGAAATYRAAIEDDPGDDAAYEALLETYAAGGAWDALYGALAERLQGVAPEERVAHELRMADAAARGGDVAGAVAHYRAILSGGAALSDAALSAMEALALSAGEAPLLRDALERRVAASGDPQDEALWLERLGDLAAFGIGAAGSARAADAARGAEDAEEAGDAATRAAAAPGDLEEAMAAWQRAAALAEGSLADPERAQKLYERVLSVAPEHRDAAGRLVSLYRKQGAWDRLAAVGEVLLDTAPTDEEALAALALLEDAAIRARTASRFVDAALKVRDRVASEGEGSAAAGEAAAEARVNDAALARARARGIDAALARVLAADPDRQDDAAAVYRRLLAPPAAGDAAPGALDTGALEAFRAFLAQSPDTLARRVDRRWLFTFVAERAHEGERLRALAAWAAWEEEIGDRAAAAALYARLIEADPENDDALAARGRLLADLGDHEGAAEVLAMRRDRSEGSARVALDVELATLLLDRLDRPADALDAIAPAIEAGTIEPAVLDVAERALRRPETQARAALLLERACDALDDPAARVALLETLLASSPAPRPPADAAPRPPADAAPGSPRGALLDAGRLAAEQRAAVRRGWFERLLELHDQDVDRGLEVALRAVAELPGELALWERIEDLGRRAKQPERVAAAYAAALDGAGAGEALPPDVIEEIGRRGVEHHEEWFDAPEAALALLRRLVELVPGSLWGFERLKLAYNAAERWEDLFALYDAMLERTPAADERVFLLEDAAAVARDLAGDGERTMRYLELLLPLQDDARTRAALERLYERHGRHRPLIDLLTAELPRLSGEAAERLRERIALLWIDGVGDAASALPVVEQLLDARPASGAAFPLLERILGAIPPEQAPAGEAGALPARAARQRSAVLLARRYREEGRPEDLVRVLEVQLEGADVDDRPALLREIVRLRRDALADEPGAFARLAELVELRPSDAGDRAELGDLAERLGRHDRLAEVLAAAEPRAGDPQQALALVRDAALLRRDRLRDAEGALALFRRLFSLAERHGDAAAARDAARALDRLFAEGDRVAERCDVLDTLAAIEEDPAARRAALGELARLASARLGDEARAIAAYSARLADDRQDLEALDGLADILEAGGRYRELTAVLERRAAVRGGEGARRDLARVARLFERELGDVEQAVATWRRVREELSPDPESGDALAALYTRTERWGDLVALLEAEAIAAGALPGGAGAARSAELFRRLGDAHRDRTLAWERAVEGYRRAHEAERAARGVLGEADERAPGGEGERGEGAARGSSTARAGLEELLRRVDPASAEHRGALVAAVGALLEICAAADDWRGQVALLEPRLAAAGTDADRVAILKASAALLEERGGDREGAFELAFRAFLLSPGGEPPEGLLRLTEVAARWHTIAEALPALERRGDVPAATLRDLTFRVGRWHRDARADQDAAERAFEQALLHDPTSSAILLDLTELLRLRRGPALVPTLLRLAAATGHDLALYREAVETARDVAGDAARAREIAAELLEIAVRRLGEEDAQAPTPGAWPPARAALWAIDALIGMLADAGDGPQVVALCRRGAALPLASSERRRLLRVAAEAAEPEEAIALYGGLFDEDPTDEPVGERLAALLHAASRRDELVRLRERQIEVSADVERRVALRYDAAELLSDAPRAAEAIALLRQNLAESPGHAASIDRLASLLEAGGLHRELMLLREEQATAREAAGGGPAAAELWLEAASLAEHELNEPERAIASYRRAAEVGSVEALDALARLLSRRGEPAAAAEALERLCAGAPADELHQAALRLADAYLAAGEADRARAALERALPRAAQPAPLRERLAYLYRASGAWGALAALIAGDAARARGEGGDAPARLALLREAADLYLTRGGAPAAAIPLFDEAILLAPDDLSLRLARSRALSAAGRTEDATAALRGIIADFGARRPKERALVHDELARVALATGDRARAMAEFDNALRIDPAHTGALDGLAVLALEDGQLERAHRAYRALLLVARRPRDEGDGLPGARRSSLPPARSSLASRPAATSFSRAEVLLALGEIARRQGAPDREAEYVESAFEAARESEAEHEKLLAALRARGRHDLLARALEARLGGPALEPAEDAAAALGELASLYEGPLDRPEPALTARLRALDLTPGAGAAHDAALELARRLDQVPRYLELVERLVARAAGEPHEVALLLRFGRALELAPGDPERAAAVYRRAEARIAAGAPSAGRDAERDMSIDVEQLWRSLEAIYERLGDRLAQADVLRKRIAHADAAPAAGAGPADRADPRYRLASLLAADPAEVDPAIALLEEALDLRAEPDRAEAILRHALRTDPRNPSAIRLFERLARQSGRPRALVDALLLLAEIEGPGVLEEAVRTARALGDREQAETILQRIVGVVAPPSSDPPGAAWALVALAELREEAGDLAAAAWLSERAARASAPEEERALLLHAAALAAGPLDDVGRAARLYEELRGREPAEREIWMPLAGVYRRSGDAARLSALLEETVPLVDDISERCALRLERARLLARESPAQAALLLRDILDEDPTQVEAAILLATMLEEAGRTEELGELFALQLDAAKDRADLASIASISMRLGALLEQRGDDRGARDVYLGAADWDGANRDVLRALVRLGRKRDTTDDLVDALEKLLRVEQGGEAAQIALELSGLHAARGDDAAAEAALKAGYAVCPASDRLREELASRYAAREAWHALADLHVLTAQVAGTDEARVESLCRAAELLRDRAGDAAAAAELLERALRVAPGDRDVLLALIDACGAVGEHARAARALTATLEASPDDPWLYRARAEVYGALGQGDSALADLERAHALGGAEYARELIAGLERALERAAARPADAEPAEPASEGAAAVTPRALRLRLAEILARSGDLERARAHLGDLLHADAKDRAALKALAGLEESAARWDAASAVYRRLIALEEGEALVATALRLAGACSRAGHLGDARGGLERALRAAPGNAAIRDRLRALYAEIGASRELAAITLEDAAAAPDVAGRFALLVAAGRLLLEVGDAPQAVSTLREARSLRPQDHEVGVSLVDALTAAGNPKEARAVTAELIAANKGRRSRLLGAVYHRLARIEDAEGNPRESLVALTRALENDPQNGELAMALGESALGLGEQDIAARAYRAVTLMKIAPEPGEAGTTLAARALAYYHLGAMALAAGDRRRARLMLDKSVSEDASLEAARALLDELRAG